MFKLEFDESRPIDFIGVGRACIDLNANEINRPMEETMTFTKYVGGSPANITIALARLGKKCGFIGKVSDDQHGRFVSGYMKNNGINTDHMYVDDSGASMGLAFTEIKSPSDCSILMYRTHVADLMLDPTEVSEEYIKNAKAMLISGTALAASPSREAVFVALDYARKHNTVVLFDLDYRPYTWKNPNEVAIYYSLAAEKCDVIFGTRDEFDMMECFTMPGNKDDKVTCAKWFGYHAKLVNIKYGQDGSNCYTSDGKMVHGGIYPAKVLKTFGAGDSYAGAFIYGLLEGWEIEKCLNYAAASASIVVSSHSCSDAMPTLEQIATFIDKCNKGQDPFAK
nr:5-dehydro-2-deoxygluconokinase [Maliibacterium massiliense]